MYQIRILIIASILFIQSVNVFGQCEVQELIPTAKLKTENYHGYSSCLISNYLIVNEPNNDSLNYNAGIIHLYKKENEIWSPFKKLSTSDPRSNQILGRELIGRDSLIVATGRLPLANGFTNEILYLYRLDYLGNWSSVETEVVSLEDTVNLGSNIRVYEMALNDNLQLAIIYNIYNDSGNQTKIKILDLSRNNEILLEETLNKSDKFFYGINTFIVFKTDALFISNPDYTSDDRTKQGAVFVFEKDLNDDWVLNPTAVLTSSIGIQFRFGVKMDYENEKLYVANASDDTQRVGLYIYDKPAEGWNNMEESRYLHKAFQYVGTDVELAVKNDNIFWSVPLFEDNFSIYIPDGSAENGYVRKEISKPDNIGDENMQFGFNPIRTNSELILNTRHTLGKISNNINEHVLIYEFEIDSIDFIEGYSYAFNGGFTSASDDEFGSQISVSENTLAITAKGSSNKWGDKAGSVYIYEKLNGAWNFEDEIIAPEPVNRDGFANEIEIYNNLLFIGAPNYDSIIDGEIFYSTGKVYVYEKQGEEWEFLTALVSPIMGTSQGQGYFGRNITYHNGYLAISEIWKNRSNSEAAGRVYLYYYNEANKNFNLQVQFENNEDYNYDDFGREVIFNDKYMVIGTGSFHRSIFRNYKVYVYKINSSEWQKGLPDYRFASNYRDNFSRYGRSIAIKDDLLLVGDPYFKNAGSTENLTGQVYGFRIPENSANGQVIYEDFSINPNVNENFRLFGSYLSVNGNDLYIKTQEFTNDILYKFDLSVINEDGNTYGNDMVIISDPEGNSNNGFGTSVEVDNGFLLVGSPEDDTESGFKSGSVIVMALQPALDSIPNFCNNTSDFELTASPLGGTWKLDQVELENNLLKICTLEPGEHTVSYILNGCEEESTFTVLPYTEISSKSPDSITKCTGDEIALFIEVNNNQNMFNWYYKKEAEDNYLLLDSAMDLTSIKITESGFYQVSLVNSQCSELEEEFQVIDHEIFPELNLKGKLELCESEISIALENTDSHEGLTWYFLAENSTSFRRIEDTENRINITESGDYFCAVNSLNCEFITDTVSVLFKSSFLDLFIPNVATVNNDGANDSFRIKTDVFLNNFKIAIYNRYGKNVYQSIDPNFQWFADDQYAGTYFYRLEFETECGGIEQRNGWVQMIK